MSDTTASENYSKSQEFEVIYIEEQAPEPWEEREPYYDKDLPIPMEDGSLSVRQISSTRVPSPLMRLKSPLSDYSQSKYLDENRVSPLPSMDRSLKTEKRGSVSTNDGMLHNIPIESDIESSNANLTNGNVKVKNFDHLESKSTKNESIYDNFATGKNFQNEGNHSVLKENMIPENDSNSPPAMHRKYRILENGSDLSSATQRGYIIPENDSNRRSVIVNKNAMSKNDPEDSSAGVQSENMMPKNDLNYSMDVEREKNIFGVGASTILENSTHKDTSDMNEIEISGEVDIFAKKKQDQMNEVEQFQLENEVENPNPRQNQNNEMLHHSSVSSASGYMQHEGQITDDDNAILNENPSGKLQENDLGDGVNSFKGISDDQNRFNIKGGNIDSERIKPVLREEDYKEIIAVSGSLIQESIKTGDKNLDQLYFASLIPLPESQESLVSENDDIFAESVEEVFRNEIEPASEHPPLEGGIKFGSISEIDNDHFWEESSTLLNEGNHFGPDVIYSQTLDEKYTENMNRSDIGGIDENQIFLDENIERNYRLDSTNKENLTVDNTRINKGETENAIESNEQKLEDGRISKAQKDNSNDESQRDAFPEDKVENGNELDGEHNKINSSDSTSIENQDDGTNHDDHVGLNLFNNFDKNASYKDKDEYLPEQYDSGPGIVTGAGTLGQIYNGIGALSCSGNISKESIVESGSVSLSDGVHALENDMAASVVQPHLSQNPEEMNHLLFLFDSLLASEAVDLNEHLKSNEITSDLYVSNWFQTLFSCENFSAEVSQIAQSEYNTRGSESLVEIAIDLMNLNGDELLEISTKDELLKKLNSGMNVEDLEMKRNFILSPELLNSLTNKWDLIVEKEKGKILADRLALLEARNRNADDLLRRLAEIIQEMNDDIVELVNENNSHRLKIKTLEDALHEKN